MTTFNCSRGRRLGIIHHTVARSRGVRKQRHSRFAPWRNRIGRPTLIVRGIQSKRGPLLLTPPRGQEIAVSVQATKAPLARGGEGSSTPLGWGWVNLLATKRNELVFIHSPAPKCYCREQVVGGVMLVARTAVPFSPLSHRKPQFRDQYRGHLLIAHPGRTVPRTPSACPLRYDHTHWPQRKMSHRLQTSGFEFAVSQVLPAHFGTEFPRPRPSW